MQTCPDFVAKIGDDEQPAVAEGDGGGAHKLEPEADGGGGGGGEPEPEDGAAPPRLKQPPRQIRVP